MFRLVAGFITAIAALVVCNLAAVTADAQAQRAAVLYTFPAPNGAIPYFSAVTQGSEGAFYGTTCDVTPVTIGSMTTYTYSGTIYKVTPGGTLTTLYTIPGVSASQNFLGWGPHSPLIQATDGNFYGTTFVNGNNLDGTVYKMTPAGVVTTLYNFTGGNDGFSPYGALLQASDGNFYGTARSGGAGGMGTIYRLSPAGVFTILHSFAANGADGANPYATLIQGFDGMLYGSTLSGGAGGDGTVFRVSMSGSGFATIHSFTGADGVEPSAPLVQLGNGALYGTTFTGGVGNYGTVFKIAPDGTGFKSLYSFTDGSDGAYPIAPVTAGRDGLLYGASEGKGTNNGAIFSLAPDGSGFVAYPFNGADGSTPASALTQARDGNFFATANAGGANSGGVVYETAPAAQVSVLHSFTSAEGPLPGGLLLAPDGDFYGTAQGGDAYHPGTIFKVDRAGNLTTLHYFQVSDGTNPVDGLTLGPDGSFYGTTSGGGTAGQGTTFRMTPAGVLTSLHSFMGGADGAYPTAGLTLGPDGNFYGSTTQAGSGGGTVFAMTPAGALTTIHAFTGAEGYDPQRRLVLHPDGNLYGTANNGGANTNGGTVFKITTSGTLTTLYSFALYGANGASPVAPPTVGLDGALYGTTQGGGPRDGGVIYRIATDGTLSNLFGFNDYTGGNPDAQLVLAQDGNFYGVTASGGSTVLGGVGAIYKVTPGGATTVIYVFTGPDGAPAFNAGLVQGNDGYLYGVSEGGGANGEGAFFRVNVGTIILPVLLFQNTTTGQMAAWTMSGPNPSSGAYITPPQTSTWRACAQADFYGDGQRDIVFQNTTSGQLAIWRMSGTQATVGTLITPSQDPSWQCVGAADFNGDGHPDLLFQNTATGALAVWYMIGSTVISGAFVTPGQDPAWHAVGAADFDGDGSADIVFQNFTTGQIGVWYMNGVMATGGQFITPNQSPAWRVVALEDLHGARQADLVFQNQNSGQLAVWYMSGVSVSGGAYILPTPAAGWTVVGPR